MSSAEEKIGECVVCCHRCGGFLMESASTTSYMVCPECGARLVVCVKKGRYPYSMTIDPRRNLLRRGMLV